jgi:hypothetical protein
MATSGTYTFSSPQNEEIVTEAYERVGILPDLLTAQKIQTANRSINLALQSWVNEGLNLWTVKQGMIALEANKNAYYLPNQGIDILDATIRTSTRNLGGTAASSAGGTADNAFDASSATSCTQTSADGNISYQWSSAFQINMVGITSEATLTYALVGEYSNDGVSWTTVLTIPSQSYTADKLNWFVVPVPSSGTYFRIRETGGATLNIQELYFNSNLNDTTISPMSRSEYMQTPNKSQVGRPSSFYVDRQITPVIYIWPTPSSLYNNLFYTYTQAIQDIGSLTENPDIPARFLEALCADLAARLAVKEKLPIDMINWLAGSAVNAYKTAGEEDRARVPLRIYGDYAQGWTQS